MPSAIKSTDATATFARSSLSSGVVALCVCLSASSGVHGIVDLPLAVLRKNSQASLGSIHGPAGGVGTTPSRSPSRIYSALIPAALMMGHHFSTSTLCKLRSTSYAFAAMERAAKTFMLLFLDVQRDVDVGLGTDG
jgi:hypothetical protein